MFDEEVHVLIRKFTKQCRDYIPETRDDDHLFVQFLYVCKYNNYDKIVTKILRKIIVLAKKRENCDYFLRLLSDFDDTVEKMVERGDGRMNEQMMWFYQYVYLKEAENSGQSLMENDDDKVKTVLSKFREVKNPNMGRVMFFELGTLPMAIRVDGMDFVDEFLEKFRITKNEKEREQAAYELFNQIMGMSRGTDSIMTTAEDVFDELERDGLFSIVLGFANSLGNADYARHRKILRSIVNLASTAEKSSKIEKGRHLRNLLDLVPELENVGELEHSMQKAKENFEEFDKETDSPTYDQFMTVIKLDHFLIEKDPEKRIHLHRYAHHFNVAHRKLKTFREKSANYNKFLLKVARLATSYDTFGEVKINLIKDHPDDVPLFPPFVYQVIPIILFVILTWKLGIYLKQRIIKFIVKRRARERKKHESREMNPKKKRQPREQKVDESLSAQPFDIPDPVDEDELGEAATLICVCCNVEFTWNDYNCYKLECDHRVSHFFAHEGCFMKSLQLQGLNGRRRKEWRMAKCIEKDCEGELIYVLPIKKGGSKGMEMFCD